MVLKALATLPFVQQLDRANKTIALYYRPLLRGIHRWQADSPHKWPVIRKESPRHDVIVFGPTHNVDRDVRQRDAGRNTRIPSRPGPRGNNVQNSGTGLVHNDLHLKTEHDVDMQMQKAMKVCEHNTYHIDVSARDVTPVR